MSQFSKTWKNLGKSNDNSKGETQAYRERLKGLSKAEAVSVLKTEYGLTEKQAAEIVADAVIKHEIINDLSLDAIKDNFIPQWTEEMTKSMSRVYGEKRKKEEDAYADLYRIVGEVEGNIRQAYLDYDKDEGLYYACVTTGDKSIGLMQSDMMSQIGEEEILESSELEKSQYKVRFEVNTGLATNSWTDTFEAKNESDLHQKIDNKMSQYQREWKGKGIYWKTFDIKSFNEIKKVSRMYGGKHLTEDEACQDLTEIVRQNSGRVLQAYIEYDEDAGLYSGEVTLCDGKVQKGISQNIADFLLNNSKKFAYSKQRLFDEVNRRFYDGKHIHNAIDDVMDYIEDTVPPEDRRLYKDIRPYGQKFQSAGILKTGTEEVDPKDYEVDGSNYNNVNNMDPGINGEDGHYDVSPTYAMINDETTKMINQLKEQLTALETRIFKSSRLERSDLIAEHKKVSAELAKAIKVEKAVIEQRVSDAVEFRKSAKTPSLKEILATRFEKRLSNSEKAALVDQIIDRFRDGDYGWRQRAILFAQGKGAGMEDVREILDAVEDDTAFSE